MTVEQTAVDCSNVLYVKSSFQTTSTLSYNSGTAFAPIASTSLDVFGFNSVQESTDCGPINSCGKFESTCTSDLLLP